MTVGPQPSSGAVGNVNTAQRRGKGWEESAGNECQRPLSLGMSLCPVTASPGARGVYAASQPSREAAEAQEVAEDEETQMEEPPDRVSQGMSEPGHR